MYVVINNVCNLLSIYRFKAMSKKETQKDNDEWHELKNNLPSGTELVGEYIHMHGVLNIMVFCYLKLIVLIHFWIGGRVSRILLDGM